MDKTTSDNYAFSVKLNRFASNIEFIKNNFKKVIVYGYGVAGKIAEQGLGQNVCAITDQSEEKVLCLSSGLALDKIKDVESDCILITVLGRELEIRQNLINLYGIDENKIKILGIEPFASNIQQIRTSISNIDDNLEYNAKRWGDKNQWLYLDKLGYSWDSGNEHTQGNVAQLADKYLRPYINNRYDLDILELSPGAGRFTSEVLRYAKTLDLVDMNQACLDLCQQKFDFSTTPIQYYLNDGKSLEMLQDRKYDLIVCFDSMVHMHCDIIDGYVAQFATLLNEHGTLWLDHSGKGEKNIGHRTDMTDSKMLALASKYGLTLLSQNYRNEHDCISVFTK